MSKQASGKVSIWSRISITWLFLILLFFCSFAPLCAGYYLIERNMYAVTIEAYAESFTAVAAGITHEGDTDLTVTSTIERGLSSVTEKYLVSYYLIDGEFRSTYLGSSNLGKQNLLPINTEVVSQRYRGHADWLLFDDPYRGDLIYTMTPLVNSSSLVCIYPVSQLDDRLQRSLLTLGVILIFSISAAFFGTATILRYVSRPAEKLVHTMRNPSLPSEVDDYAHWHNELGEMCSAYLTRARDYRESLETINSLNDQRRESEIEVLQNQINSHFIYNTLNNIQWLASAHRTDDVITTVKALDLLLRAWALNDTDFVTIEEEMNYVEAYLVAQKIRFNDVFDFKFDLDVLLMQMKTPKFILQPIVENSIYHGFIDADRKGGHITISMRRRGHRIVIEVLD
ncbi:MAG: histidine kinase, partial [Oscillospiraceae bacterium]